MTNYTLVVADDHPLFREAIGAVIEAGLPGCRLLEADSLARALQRWRLDRKAA